MDNEKPQKIKAVNSQPWVHFMAGGVGGTVGAVLTCPLEVIKTRLQSSLYRNQHHLSVRQLMKKIYLEEGVAGLWRGLGPNLVGVIPARAVHFSTYASVKHYFTHDVPLNNGQESTLIHLLSAASAGVATATLTNPIWLIKTRMQLQQRPISQDSLKPQKSSTAVNRISVSPVSSLSATREQRPKISAVQYSTTTVHAPMYKNSLDCTIKVLQQEGVRGLFRGLTASYLGIFEGTLQWVIYEKLKKSLATHRQSATPTYSTATTTTNPNTSTSSPPTPQKQQISQAKPTLSQTAMDSLLTASTSKFIAAALTYPHEVLRTRLRQVSVDQNGVGRPRYSSLVDVVRCVLREEGFTAFYGGMTAHLLRTVPNAAIMFLCYESVVFFMKPT